MANRKISELVALTTPASGDYVPIVDISEVSTADQNKRITVEELFRGVPSGTAAAPSIAPESDPDSGVYSSGADQVSIATGGVECVRFNSSGLVFNSSYTEKVFAVTGTTPALSPANGSIQTWTLTAASTPTAGTWNDGQSLTLAVDDGTAYTITWSSVAVTWKTDTGTAPTLNTTGITFISLWKVGGVVYGARVGNA